MMELPLTVTTASAEETEGVGKALAACFAEADCALPPFIALYGDLGVGKTAFVRGFASLLSPNALVRSPTFALVNEYRGSRPLFHFDMYRIESEEDLYSIGYDDYPDAGICVAEWCEKIPYALPQRRWEVTIRKDADEVNTRHITIALIHESLTQKEVFPC